MDRRSFLAGASSTGLAVVTGCLGTSGTEVEQPPFPEYATDAQGYNGVVDRTGLDEVEVEVGAGNGLAFVPTAVRVSTGTTVRWRWLGRGGAHNVVELGDGFESNLVTERGHTFTVSFEAPGTHNYYCRPHRGAGMKGAVEVV
jgi:halocyanin-like protein